MMTVALCSPGVLFLLTFLSYVFFTFVFPSIYDMGHDNVGYAAYSRTNPRAIKSDETVRQVEVDLGPSEEN